MPASPGETRSRLVRDRHGRPLGRVHGPRLDPDDHGAVTVALSPEAADALRLDEAAVTVEEALVASIRRDELTLDATLDELADMLEHASPPDRVARKRDRAAADA